MTKLIGYKNVITWSYKVVSTLISSTKYFTILLRSIPTANRNGEIPSYKMNSAHIY